MNRTNVSRAIFALAACLHMTSAAGDDGHDAATGHDGETQRISVSLHFSRDGRDRSVPDKVSRDEHPIVKGDASSQPRSRPNRQSKGGEQTQRSINTDFWFYTADVELFGDHDNDGYFHGIDLLFDADTLYEVADVYAVMYLSQDGGPWLEYAATDVFSLYGATSDDDYVVVTELVAGYPSGSYDILIELWDTWDGSFVAEFGPADTPALAFLPLEDTERDEPYVEPDVVFVDQGGGSVGLLPVFVLLSTLLVRARRRVAS